MRQFYLFIVFIFSSCVDYVPDPPEVARRLKGEFPTEETPGAPPWPSTTCDAVDLKIFDQRPEFSDDWSSCARDYGGDKDNTSACLRTIYSGEFSRSCASCFGEFAACGRKECFWTCARTLGKGESCERCGWERCGDRWEQCTGFTRRKLSKYY